MSKKLVIVVSLATVLAMVLTGCGVTPTATPAPTQTARVETKVVQQTVVVPQTVAVPQTVVVQQTQVVVVTATPVVPPTATKAPTPVPSPTNPPPVLTKGEGCAPNATKITWYVGLGTGSQPDQVTAERAWVDKFNKSQTEACVVLNVVFNSGTNSYDALKALLAAGNAPDIVGPVGKMGRASFQGAWADIAPLATAAGFDLTKYDPALLEFTRDEGVLVGIPFALFPSFIYYNKALFDEAKLPYPPHKVGEKYQGKDWNLDTFTELARKLTVDGKGNDATSASFDTKTVKQFGFYEQWTDARGAAAFFAGGLPYDPKDPKTAVIPDAWKQAWNWFYDGIWKNHFMPTADYANSEGFANGNCGSSGRIGMWWTHTWYTCCFDLAKTKWDIAVVPQINGKTTAKLHGDTFAILNASKNKAVAFKVLSKMIVDKDLYNLYGGMPAVLADRPAFFAALDAKAAPNKVDWSVAEAMVGYPDLPNHESWLPNMVKANDLFTAFRNLMEQTPNLNIDDQIIKLRLDLSAAFKQAQ